SRGGRVTDGSAAALSVTEDPAAQEAVLQQRQYQDDREQDDRLSRSQTEVVPAAEGVEDDDTGRVDGIAGGSVAHHVDMGEGLERAYEAEDRQVEGHGRQQRDGDHAELLPPRGTVYGSGLVELLRDVAEAREEDDGVVAGER